jgi:hypothetical protein
MHRVLTVSPEQAGRVSGFVKRESKLTAAKFAQTTVLGFLSDPQTTLEQLAQMATAVGVPITRQAIEQRFTKEAAVLLECVLNAAVREVIASDPAAIPLLQRFSAVILQDSSIINLPDILAEVWRGCGGTNGTHAAALKIDVRLDVLNGTLCGPLLKHGRTHDRTSSSPEAPLPESALYVADLGYFKLDRLSEIGAGRAFFLTRLFLQTLVLNEQGKELDLLRLLEDAQGSVELPVQIGSKERLAVRLLAVPVPEEVTNRRRQRLKEEARRRGRAVSTKTLALAAWTILVTNVPAEMLSLQEALVMLRVRWQIELLFKLWKDGGKVDEWRSENAWRILCEVYAKLTGMVIQHWLFLVSFWGRPDRSWVKGAQTVRDNVPLLAMAMADLIETGVAIQQITRCLAGGCRMDKRKKHPHTYQLLLGFQDAA